MSVHHPHALRRRAMGAYVILGLMMGVLVIGFFRIQVIQGEEARLKAETNRVRSLPVPAPRGTIYDRKGQIVADNVPGYQVTILPASVDSVRATLRRMQQYMHLSDERIERVIRTLRAYGREVVVESDADFAAVAALEERRSDFPGVFVEMRPRRRYHLGPAGGHVTGYVGEITGDELGTESFPDSLYEAGMIVGKIGIERHYEHHLQGSQGTRHVEFDARGRIVGDFGGAPQIAPVPGEDLYLNLDLELQQWVHRIFPDSMSGAVVALDPTDGTVLASEYVPFRVLAPTEIRRLGERLAGLAKRRAPQ